jgi:hypothetical protein
MKCPLCTEKALAAQEARTFIYMHKAVTLWYADVER